LSGLTLPGEHHALDCRERMIVYSRQSYKRVHINKCIHLMTVVSARIVQCSLGVVLASATARLRDAVATPCGLGKGCDCAMAIFVAVHAILWQSIPNGTFALILGWWSAAVARVVHPTAGCDVRVLWLTCLLWVVALVSCHICLGLCSGHLSWAYPLFVSTMLALRGLASHEGRSLWC